MSNDLSLVRQTGIPGITEHIGQGGDRWYEVTFTLFLYEAKDAEEAGEQAMRYRRAVAEAEDPDGVDGLDFLWHLHDHDGCGTPT